MHIMYVFVVGALPISPQWTPLTVISTERFCCQEADQSRSAPLKVSGSTSTGRVICGTDLAECVSVPGDFLQPQGAFYSLRGVGFIARRLRAPLIRGMPDGATGIFGNAGRMWAPAMRPGTTKKRPCATLAR